eukprot:914939-Pelagomonas_calceolata.AAC.2
MQAMRPPAVVFPVGDLNTCTALPARTIATGGGLLLGGEDAKARAAEGVWDVLPRYIATAGGMPQDRQPHMYTGACASGTRPTVLRDAVLMKPGSTPADLFSVLVRPPWQLLEGEFVRAEARVLQVSMYCTLKLTLPRCWNMERQRLWLEFVDAQWISVWGMDKCPLVQQAYHP